MFYKHQYFTLDTKRKEVFDENNKPLRLTGNAFRLLVFLCVQNSATITEIGEELDSAKDYDENNVRQYKYKVNTVIGHDIIEYRNGIYSIIGEVKEVEEDRNTGLLRIEDVNLEKKNNMGKENDLKFYIAPGIIAIIFLILSLFSWPYGYYRLSRIVITVIAIYYAYYLYTSLQRKDFWFWLLVVIVILFNPIFPIYLYDRAIWGVIDIIAAIILGILIIKFKKK